MAVALLMALGLLVVVVVSVLLMVLLLVLVVVVVKGWVRGGDGIPLGRRKQWSGSAEGLYEL